MMRPMPIPLLLLAACAAAGIALLLPGPATASFVAVGSGGTIVTSPDGASWSAQTSGTSQNLRDVATDNTKWVAVGNGGTILGSATGSAWSAMCPPGAASGCVGGFLNGIGTDGSDWVTAGAGPASTDNFLLTSPGGGTWAWTWTPNNPLGGARVAADANEWAVVAVTGGQTSNTLYTSSGPPWSWAVNALSGAGSLSDVATDGSGTWIAAGLNGGNNVFLKSTTASPAGSWTTLCSTPAAGCPVAQRIAYGDGSWLAWNSNGAPGAKVWRSTNGGATWSGPASLPSGAGAMTEFAWDGCIWVGVGRHINPSMGSTIVTSTDGGGESWVQQYSGITAQGLLAVAAKQCPPKCSPLSQSVVAGTAATLAAQGVSPFSWSATGSPSPATPWTGTPYTPTWASSGSHSVTVSAGNPVQTSNPCTVTVVAPLSCSASPSSVLVGTQVTFTRLGGNGTPDWTPSAGSATAAGPGATFSTSWSTPGAQSVTVSNTSPAQAATCSVLVVGPLSCSALPAAVVSGSTATLAASGGSAPHTWSATGGWPASGSGASLGITYITIGTHTATVTTAAPAQSADCTIRVAPALACTGPANGLVDAALDFAALGGSPPYAWSGGGTPATDSGSLFQTRFSAPGAWTVTVTDAGPPAQTATCAVDAYDAVACSPAAQPALVDRAVQLQALGGVGGTGPYAWSAPGGIVTAGVGTTFTTSFQVPGRYAVSLIGSGGAAVCFVQAVTPPPPPPPDPLPYPSAPHPGGPRPTSYPPTAVLGMHVLEACGDGWALLDAAASSDQDGVVVAWSWDFGDGTFASGPSVRHRFDTAGPHRVTLTVQDDTGILGAAGLDLAFPPCAPLALDATPLSVPADKRATACVQATGGEPPYRYEHEPGSLPAGAQFDDATGCLEWTPGRGDVGLHCIPVLAADHRHRASTCIQVEVLAPPPSRPSAAVPQVPTPSAAPEDGAEVKARLPPDPHPPPAAPPTSDGGAGWGLAAPLLAAVVVLAFSGGIAVMKLRRRRPRAPPSGHA